VDGEQESQTKIKRIPSVFKGKLSMKKGARDRFVEGDHGMGSTFGDRAPYLTYTECRLGRDNGTEIFGAINSLKHLVK